MLVLTSLSFSPWSEKARWALDHHQIIYQSESYVPGLGELKLRLQMRKLSGRITVPVLYDGKSWYTDSFDIARQADRLGGASRLFPADRLGEITTWNQRSESALAAGRALMMLAMAKDPNAALVFLPFKVPAIVKPLLLPVAKKGMETFIAKYRMRDDAESHAAVFKRELDLFSQAVANRRYLVGDSFSYADIAMALVLQGISPVDERYMARVPGSRPSAVTAELQRRYAHLITWRDELYAQHRQSKNTRSYPL